jgi:abortive infection bacteriophage resistance protein
LQGFQMFTDDVQYGGQAPSHSRKAGGEGSFFGDHGPTMQTPQHQRAYKTYEGQLSIIEERGILVTDRQDAITHLKRLGYYRLSGYWYPFRQRSEGHREGIDKPSDHVVEGVAFADIVAICDFDGRLRNVLMDAISAVEVAVRVAVAYQMGRYGPLGYLDKNNFGPGRDNPSYMDPSISDFDQFCQK